MKKIFSMIWEFISYPGVWISALIVALVLTVGAVSASAVRAEEQQTAFDERFVVISDAEHGNLRTVVVADRQTRVEYLWTSERSKGNSMVMLANADGQPLLYEGELPGE